MSCVSMIKSRITISKHSRLYDYEFESLLYRLMLSITYRNILLTDGCNMVNNKCIDNICRKLTQRKHEVFQDDD